MQALVKLGANGVAGLAGPKPTAIGALRVGADGGREVARDAVRARVGS